MGMCARLAASGTMSGRRTIIKQLVQKGVA
jgi:hypothetical protein